MSEHELDYREQNMKNTSKKIFNPNQEGNADFKVTSYLTPNLKAMVARYAERHNVSMSYAVCKLLTILTDITDATKDVE